MSDKPTPTQPTEPQSDKNKAVPLRALVINLLFSMFTSLVIFSVASYYFLVPQIARQSADIEQMKLQVQQLDQRTSEEATAAADDEAAPADEAQAAADEQPADAQAPAADDEAAAKPAADQAAAAAVTP